MDIKKYILNALSYVAPLIESNSRLSSTKFFLTLFNISLLAIIWHKELTQPHGVSGELLVVAFGLLAGNYQVSKMQRFKSTPSTHSSSTTNSQPDADKENNNGE